MLTRNHLCRLADLADVDHMFFARSGGRPEYRSRRVAVVLAQGAAVHYFHGLADAPLQNTSSWRHREICGIGSADRPSGIGAPLVFRGSRSTAAFGYTLTLRTRVGLLLTMEHIVMSLTCDAVRRRAIVGMYYRG